MWVNSIPKFANRIGIGIDGIVPMTAKNNIGYGDLKYAGIQMGARYAALCKVIFIEHVM